MLHKDKKKFEWNNDVTYVNDTFLDVYIRDMLLAHSKAPVCLKKWKEKYLNLLL